MKEELILSKENITKENIETLMNNYKTDRLLIAMITEQKQILPIASTITIDDLFITNILAYNKDCKIIIQNSIIGRTMCLLFDKSYITRLHLLYYKYINKFKGKCNIQVKVTDGTYIDLDNTPVESIKIKENINNDYLQLNIYDKNKHIMTFDNILYIGKFLENELYISVLKHKNSKPYVEYYYIVRED